MNNLKLVYNKDIRNKELFEKNELVISSNKEKVISFYKDDIWDLSYRLSNNNASNIKNINFSIKKIKYNQKNISEYPFLYESLKDITYKMIVKGDKIQTIHNNVNKIVLFFNYMIEFCKKYNVNDLNKEEIENYFYYLKKEKKEYTNSVISSYLNAVKFFFRYRKEIKYKIDFEPFQQIFINNKKNNQKKIIPDEEWKFITKECEKEINKFLNNLEEEEFIINHYIKKIKKGMKLKARDIKHSSKYFNDNYKNIMEHKDYLENIQYYSAILIQAYTGMRISEVFSLKKGCILKEKYEKLNSEILKIKGFSFKYEDLVSIDSKEGKEVEWYCPNILKSVIKVLELISKYTTEVLKHHGINNHTGKLFVSVKKPIAKLKTKNASFQRFEINYDKKINELGINTSFKITSHNFRRTFARFLARSILKIEVDIIKEQFKHFSKDITLYYMRESEKLDSSFSELIEGYIKEKEDTIEKKVLFEKIDSKISKALVTANNYNELSIFMAGRQLKVVNDYASTINEENSVFSPIECLTCEGNIILPEVHKSYWIELELMYEELINLEPNSIRFKQELNMVKKVIKKLNKNEAYISGENNE